MSLKQNEHDENENANLLDEYEKLAYEIEKQIIENEKFSNHEVYDIPKAKSNVIKKGSCLTKYDGNAQEEPAIKTKELTNLRNYEKIIYLVSNTHTSYDSFLRELQNNNIDYKEGLTKINKITDKLQILKDLKVEEKLAVYIYNASLKDKTGKIVCSQINDILREEKLNEIEGYKVFISILCKAIFKLPNEWYTVYRGFKLTEKEIGEYIQGETILWKAFSSSTLDRTVAMEFAKKNFSGQSQLNKKSVIIKINSARAPLIDKLSPYPYEKGVLFQAFTYFEVKSNQLNPTNGIVEIELNYKGSEIEVGNNVEKKTLIWVDSNHENNQKILDTLDENIVHLITISSTVGALSYITENTNLLKSDLSKFRIITNMVRDENGVKNYEAGIDLIQRLRSLSYDGLVFLYCSQNTKKIFLEKNGDKLQNFGQICIENDEAECLNFATFQNLS